MLLLGVWLTLNGQSDISQFHVYHHLGLRLTVRYPAKWVVEEHPSIFDVVSFPLRQRPPRILVPENGAEITIGGPPAGVSSIATWVKDDRIQPEDGDVITRTVIETRCCGKSEINVVRTSAEAGIPKGRNVICYMVLNGRLVKVALLYRGQGRSKYFENVLFSLIKSLRPD
jgi:hypothetical protein